MMFPAYLGGLEANLDVFRKNLIFIHGLDPPEGVLPTVYFPSSLNPTHAISSDYFESLNMFKHVLGPYITF